MSKPSRRARKEARAKELMLEQQHLQEQAALKARGFAGQFELATKRVRGALNEIPSSTIYWGLGALALGAAAYGAYTYRERIISMYDDAAESLEGIITDLKSDSSVSKKRVTKRVAAPARRRAKTSSASQARSH